jgi:hypothetical protein
LIFKRNLMNLLFYLLFKITLLTLLTDSLSPLTFQLNFYNKKKLFQTIKMIKSNYNYHLLLELLLAPF